MDQESANVSDAGDRETNDGETKAPEPTTTPTTTPTITKGLISLGEQQLAQVHILGERCRELGVDLDVTLLMALRLGLMEDLLFGAQRGEYPPDHELAGQLIADDKRLAYELRLVRAVSDHIEKVAPRIMEERSQERQRALLDGVGAVDFDGLKLPGG